MELIQAYKLVGFLCLLFLILSTIFKKGKLKLMSLIMFKVFLVGYYFFTFFVPGNVIALAINYAVLLILIVLMVFQVILRKYIPAKLKAYFGLTLLISVVILVITSFFV